SAAFDHTDGFSALLCPALWPSPGEVWGKFFQRLLIDLPLELDHRFHRRPILAPPPRVEFRLARSAQAHVAIPPYEPQQKPDLLLAAIVAAPFPAQPAVGHVVAQPFPGAPQDTNMLRIQACFLLQLPIHRRLRSFALPDASLGELPGMLPDPL